MSFSDPSVLSLPPFLRWLSALLAPSSNARQSKAATQTLTEEEAFLAASTDAADCERRQRLLERRRDVISRNYFM